MLLATLALFVVSLGYGVVAPVLPRLAAASDGAASPSELSVVYASYAVMKIAAQIPGGVWVDRRGPKVVLVVALVLYIASLVAFLVPFGPIWFAGARALEGVATGLAYPAVFARVLITSSKERAGRNLGMAVGIGSAGLLIGPVLGALLGKRSAAPPILLVAALGAVVLLWSIADRRKGIAPTEREQRTMRGELSMLLRLARDWAFVTAMLPIAYNKLTFSAYEGLLPLVGPRELGVGDTGVAFLFVLVGAVFAIAQPVGGALVDRLGASRVVVATIPVLLFALAAIVLSKSLVFFSVLFGLHIFAQSVVFTATMKHAATAHASASTYGGVFGLLSTVTDTMTVVGPLVFLNAYGAMGHSVFAVMATVGVVFAVPFLRSVSRGASM